MNVMFKKKKKAKEVTGHLVATIFNKGPLNLTRKRGFPLKPYVKGSSRVLKRTPMLEGTKDSYVLFSVIMFLLFYVNKMCCCLFSICSYGEGNAFRIHECENKLDQLNAR